MKGGNEMINYYDLLGVSPDATDEEIRKAYKKNMKYYHPDINKSANAENMSKALNNARDILLDPLKREAYDIELGISKEQHRYHQDDENVQYDSSYGHNESTDQEQNIYYFETVTEAFNYWMKNSDHGILRKMFSILAMIFIWIFCKLLMIIEIPVYAILSMINEMGRIWLMIGALCFLIQLFLGFDYFDFVPDLKSKIFLYIVTIFMFIGPSLLSDILIDSLPRWVYAINSQGNLLMMKVMGFRKL